MILTGSASPPYFAQFGEDRILEEIFGYKKAGNCIEVGANDGITDSMTYHFELMGWTCLLVEPIPELYEKILINRKGASYNYAASSQEGEATLLFVDGVASMSTLEVTEGRRKSISRAGGKIKEIRVRKRTLDSILSESGVSNIDFASIDVEGHELEVLKGFSVDKYHPKIILIEDNSNATDTTIPDFMKSRGYAIFKRTGVNDWYARESDQELIPPGQATLLLKTRNRVAREYQLARRFSSLVQYIPEAWKPVIRKILGLNPG